jgi:hypothetical protein
MAFVNIQNGQVERIIKDKGFVVVENYKTRDGDEKQTKYTVWTDNPNDIPGEGVTVNVSGALSVKVQEFENDQGETIRFASINVNRPKITLVDLPATAPSSARQSQSPVTDWEAAF